MGLPHTATYAIHVWSLEYQNLCLNFTNKPCIPNTFVPKKKGFCVLKHQEFGTERMYSLPHNTCRICALLDIDTLLQYPSMSHV